MRVPRNANLDALRGIAILLVAGRHLDYFPLWTKIGWSGVDLFFVLSGFLISGLLFEEWKKDGEINLRRFYLRRGLKIYPSFYALLAVSVLVNLARPGIPSYPVTWRSVLTESVFVQNYFTGVWGQTWSLAVEEHFYITLPIVLWLLYRRRGRNPFQSLPTIFMAVATIEIVLRFATTWNMSTPKDEIFYLCPTHLRMDALLFGVALSYYRHFEREKFEEIAHSSSAMIVAILALVLLAVVPLNNPIMHTIGFSLVFFGFGVLLARVIDAQPNRFAVWPLAKIGYYSYSIYLWHGWVCRIVRHDSARGFVLSIACMIALGVVMAKIIEGPVLSLRDRYVPSQILSDHAGLSVGSEEARVVELCGIAPDDTTCSI